MTDVESVEHSINTYQHLSTLPATTNGTQANFSESVRLKDGTPAVIGMKVKTPDGTPSEIVGIESENSVKLKELDHQFAAYSLEVADTITSPTLTKLKEVTDEAKI